MIGRHINMNNSKKILKEYINNLANEYSKYFDKEEKKIFETLKR